MITETTTTTTPALPAPPPAALILRPPGPSGPELFIHENKVYEKVLAGPWDACAPVTVKPGTPAIRWQGGKIPPELWTELMAFFEWSMAETKSEVVAHLFYHEEEQRWQTLVLPQAGYEGMTVKLIDDHPNRIPTYQRLGRGWKPMGTVHHHCTASAFASGTDAADERTKEGLHITIGGVTHDRYSIHARTTFRHQVVDDKQVDLSNWFDWPIPAIADALPNWMHDAAIRYQLTTPPSKEATFPDWWKQNVIKVERPKTTWTYSEPGFLSHHTAGARYSYQAGQKTTSYVDILNFRNDLRKLAHQYGYDSDELADMTSVFSDSGYDDLIELAMRSNLDIQEVERECAAVVKEMGEKEMKEAMGEHAADEEGGTAKVVGFGHGDGVIEGEWSHGDHDGSALAASAYDHVTQQEQEAEEAYRQYLLSQDPTLSDKDVDDLLANRYGNHISDK